MPDQVNNRPYPSESNSNEDSRSQKDQAMQNPFPYPQPDQKDLPLPIEDNNSIDNDSLEATAPMSAEDVRRMLYERAPSPQEDRDVQVEDSTLPEDEFDDRPGILSLLNDDELFMRHFVKLGLLFIICSAIYGLVWWDLAGFIALLAMGLYLIYKGKTYEL